ncbi:dermonecrotic toxin domain-containing protein [Pseudomonas azotoformans]|uniref:dermonecrotic toxin domain-containing protein n=1 Tax=Pseudomonas azotoformans TaxID=47878 RepID=UPI00087DAC08|nr:DUF6543 domain-containing protein [Pseudomonas azotoformans]SDN65548.1 hypothetical protein SAMN04489799_2510 [Pseudomonas azotoformans]
MSSDPLNPTVSAPDTVPVETYDLDSPIQASEARDQAVRRLLTRRLNASAQPSRLINQWHLVNTRCIESSKALKRLIGRAPRLLRVIRFALQEAFGLDPDNLLFTEPTPPRPAQKVDSLTERALALFSDPSLPINLNQYTALSLKDDPARTLPFTALQALERVKGLGLMARLDNQVREYWQYLAYGSWLTRQARWVQLRKRLFIDAGFLAHQLDELSDAGWVLVQQVADAPSGEARKCAGGDWAGVRVSTVLWPGTFQTALAIPGALHLCREGAAQQAPHVIYLPGMARAFYEFSAWEQVQCGLTSLLNGALFSVLWQCLPLRRRHEACRGETRLARGAALTGDALQHSAIAVLDAQWDNELACALSINHATVAAPASPGRDTARFLRFIEKGRDRLAIAEHLGASLGTLLGWDATRRAAEIILGQLPSGLALRSREQQVERYEKRLMTLLDPQDPSRENTAYDALVTLNGQWQAQTDAVQALSLGPDERLLSPAFWLEHPDDRRNRTTLLLIAQREALLQEVQRLQHLKLMAEAPLQRLVEVLNKPQASDRNGSDTCVLRVLLGGEGMLGAFVVTTKQAHATPVRTQPVLLCVAGRFGGLAAFDNLETLSERLRASLGSRDGSPLWQCVGRDRRQALKTASDIKVTYEVLEEHVLHHGLTELINHYARLDQGLDQGSRLFSEVRDPALVRMLLAAEMREHLQVPAHDAVTEAMANLELLRFAAAQAKKLPAWLGQAQADQRNAYRRLQLHYLSSAQAFEAKLWRELPELEAFARKLLIAQLKLDGLYPEVDIDQPLLDMPDDVSAYFCGWTSQCAVGERDIKKVVSPQRTTFSLLQLALHNLDAQAPWTEWRLNRARYLAPQWQQRLNSRYLIKTLAALDIGGRYDTLIQQVFYPPASAPPALPGGLVDRVLRQQARMHVFSAAQQGLGAKAQSVFNTLMAAQAVADLNRNGHRLRLHFVRLCGHTLEHDRHIAGVLVTHDESTGLWLVYWPAAVDGPAIAEYTSREQAVAALNKAWATPANVKALAHRVAPGWETQAIASYPAAGSEGAMVATGGSRLVFAPVRGFYVLETVEAMARFIRSFKVKHRVPAVVVEDIQTQINEQIATAPKAWLDFSTTTASHALALLAHARMFEIQHRAQGRAVSARTLQAYRQERLGEQHAATLRGVLSFVPVIGLGVSLYEILLAARRFHHSRQPGDAVDLGFVTLLGFVDVLTAFIPGPKSARVTGVAATRASMRGALGRLHRRHGLVGGGLSALKPSTILPAKALERFRKDLPPSAAIELQGPGNRGTYVKGGEQFVLDDTHQYPVYRRQDDQVLRLKHPQDDVQNELILHIEEPGEWLLGADAPPAQPQPGPSTEMWRPWATTPSAQEWSPPSHAMLQEHVGRAAHLPGAGQGWGFDSRWVLTDLLPERGIFRVSGGEGERAFDVLRQDGRLFRLLPEGTNSSFQSIIFLTRNRALAPQAATDIHFWLGAGFSEQPIPATLGADGLWKARPVLFLEPLENTMGRVFPRMKELSRRFASERLIELADAGREVTASHLLTIRATLDDWLAPGAVGHTDDLLKMLRPTYSRRRLAFYIGYEGRSPGFTRMDFTLPAPLDPSWRVSTRENASARAQVVQAVIAQMLEQQGFVIRSIEKRMGGQYSVDYFCTHPKSNARYYVLTRWVKDSTVNLRSATSVQLTDEWFRRRSVARTYSEHMPEISRALNQNRLVKIIAGIQWTSRSNPTVFFVKFGGVSS